MEASEALEQGGEQPAEAPANEQPQEATPEQNIGTFAQQEQGPPPWLDSVNENFTKQLGQFQQHLDQRLSPLEQALQQQPEPQEPYDDYLGYLDDSLGGVDPNQIQSLVRETMQQELAPLKDYQHGQAWDAFHEAYPEIGESEELQAQVGAAAQSIAEAAGLTGDALAEKLEDPRFVSEVYERTRGEQEEGQEEGQPQEPEGNVFQQLWDEKRNSPQQTLQDQLDATVDQRVEEQMAPIREEVLKTRQQQTDEQWQNLMQEFPDLATEQGAAPVAAAVQEWTARWGHPELARDPTVARLMFLAQKGEEAAAAERPAGDGSDAQLEQGGASPPVSEQDDEFIQLWSERQSQTLPWD